MIVDNNINTSKYVSFKDLAKYVLVSGTTCLNPYTSAFKTLWVESGSGNTRSHQLRHNEAAGYGFTFHDGVNTGNTKLCLPEEMIALNPKIVFGGLSTGNGDDWVTFSSIGADTFDSEDKVYGRYVFKINFADNTYCTIRFETSYLDQDEADNNLNSYWYEKCVDNTFYNQSGAQTSESNYIGKELSSFELLSVDLIQGEDHGTINSWSYSGSSLYLNTTRGNYDCFHGNSENGYFTTGVTQNDILVSNVGGYSNKNITVYMTPSIGITFSYTRDSQGCTSECTADCPSESPSYTLTVSPTFKGIERGGTSSMIEDVFVTVNTTAPSWGFNETCSWLSAAKSGTTRIKFTASNNTGDPRTCYVTVTAGTLSRTVEIQQAGASQCTSDCPANCPSDCPSECPSECTGEVIPPTVLTATFYKADGTTVVGTYTGYSGDAIVRPSVYSKEGYTVTWPSTPTNFASSNVSIIAIETVNSYKRHYDVWHASGLTSQWVHPARSSITTNYGTSFASPIYPSNDIPSYMEWSGWTIESGTMPANDLYISGYTVPHKYALEYYHPDSVTLYNRATYKYGETMLKLQPPAGYHWVGEPAGSIMDGHDYVVTSEEDTLCRRDVICTCDSSDLCGSECPKEGLPTDTMTLNVSHTVTNKLYEEYQFTIDLYYNNSSVWSATYRSQNPNGTTALTVGNVAYLEDEAVDVRADFQGKISNVWGATQQMSVSPQQIVVKTGMIRIIDISIDFT